MSNTNPYQLQLSTETILIVSDVHLQPARPKTFHKFLQWLEYAGQNADKIIILGDLFEVWFGDEMIHLPMGQHLKPLLDALKKITEKKEVYFLAGNRDFLVGNAFSQITGVQIIDEPLQIKTRANTILLCHGDALCTKDVDYQSFRKLVRNHEWQAQFLSYPFEERLAMAQKLRDNSEQVKQEQGYQDYMDVVEEDCLAFLSKYQSDVLVHGHTHLPGKYELIEPQQNKTYTRWVLPDWDYDTTEKGGYLKVKASGNMALETF